MTENAVLALMREDDLKHDPWGTAMGWAFGVAEALLTSGEEVPAELGYGPSPYVVMTEPDPEDNRQAADVWHLLHRTPGHWVTPGYGATVEEIQHAGRIIARYLTWCKRAGRDY